MSENSENLSLEEQISVLSSAIFALNQRVEIIAENCQKFFEAHDMTFDEIADDVSNMEQNIEELQNNVKYLATEIDVNL